jgi:sigma-B regulation protein RsbU (phosphoserine phosphatase)
MAISHSLFRTLSAQDDRPEHIMTALNNAISDNNPDIMFITLFLGVMDLDTGTVSYCNAGHNPPIIVRSGRAEYLDTEPSLILGVELSAEYTVKELTLASGDALFLYTDGLTEAENAEKEVFGEGRALEAAATFGTQTAEQQIEQMHQAVRVFVNHAEQSDDLTMLSIRYVHADNTLVMENRIEELDKLEPFLSRFFEQESVDMSLLPQLDLALEEAVTNVIMYAYPEGEKGTALWNRHYRKRRGTYCLHRQHPNYGNKPGNNRPATNPVPNSISDIEQNHRQGLHAPHRQWEIPHTYNRYEPISTPARIGREAINESYEI